MNLSVLQRAGIFLALALVMMATRVDTRKAISMFNAYWLDEHSITVTLAQRRLVRASGYPRRSQL